MGSNSRPISWYGWWMILFITIYGLIRHIYLLLEIRLQMVCGRYRAHREYNQASKCLTCSHTSAPNISLETSSRECPMMFWQNLWCSRGLWKCQSLRSSPGFAWLEICSDSSNLDAGSSSSGCVL